MNLDGAIKGLIAFGIIIGLGIAMLVYFIYWLWQHLEIYWV